MVSSSSSVQAMVSSTAAQYGVPPALALAVASMESGFNQAAVSSSGAIGVMQLEPATAADLGVDPTNLSANITGGVRYLAQLYSQFGDWSAALAAYNWGEGNVAGAISGNGASWFSTIPSSVQGYVNSILGAAGMSYAAVAQSPAPADDASDDSGDYADYGDDTDVDDSALDASMVPALTSPNMIFYLTAAGLGVFIAAHFFE